MSKKNKKLVRFNTYDNKEKKAVLRVLKSGVLSGFLGNRVSGLKGGPYVNKFETNIKNFFNVKYAITVNSWSTGLTCAVGAIGIEPGDEIILPTWTMTACSAAVLHWNAIPVFADIDSETFNICIKSIKKNITKKTKAIMVVDIFGLPSNYKEIKKIAKKHKLKIICDSAQSPGATYYGKHCATLGDVGGYSLNYHKHIHTGEGGILVTNNNKIARNLRLLRNHAEAVVSEKTNKKNLINMIGNNFRLGEMEASIGIEQLKKLNTIIKARLKISKYLINKLKKIKFIKLPKNYKNIKNVFYVIPILLDIKKIKFSRKKILKELNKFGAKGLTEGYVNLHTQPLFKNKICYGSKGFPWSFFKNKISYKKGICPVAENFHEKSLLLYQGVSLYDLTKTNVDDLVLAFKKTWKKLGIN